MIEQPVTVKICDSLEESQGVKTFFFKLDFKLFKRERQRPCPHGFHVFCNNLDFALLKCADYIGNKPYRISLPYNFLDMASWHRLIKKNNLKIIKSQKFSYNIFDPIKHIIFKLELLN